MAPEARRAHQRQQATSTSSTATASRSVYRKKAGTNGLLFDREGRLVACEPESAPRHAAPTATASVTVLTDKFDGKKYNQPNDLTIDSKGRIYFSDPRYGAARTWR